MGTFTITQQPSSTNLYLYPNGSSATQLTAYGQTENYACVDEVWSAANDDTDYVYSDSIATIQDLYALPNHTTETGTINYVRVVANSKSNVENQSSSATFQLVCADDSATTYSLNQAPLTISYTKYSYLFDEKPSTGTWTWSDIDNLKIGIMHSSPSVNHEFAWVSRPTSDVAGSPFLKTGCASHYQCVNDEVANDSTYIYGTYGSILYHHFLMANHTTQTENIKRVKFHARCKEHGSRRYNLGLGYRYNGTNYQVELFVKPGCSWINKSTTTAINQESGSTFTWSDIDTIDAWVSSDYESHIYGGCGGGSGYGIDVSHYYMTVYYDKVAYNPEIRTTQCYAVVNYDPPVSTVTLTMPKSLRLDHSRQIKRHNFPSGNYQVDDYGRGGKTLTITGWENSSATAKMQSLKDMCHYGDKITIADLPDSNLNRDYHIIDYSFQQGGGEVDMYEWSLTLEED